MHQKDNCVDVKKAIARGEVRQRGKIVQLGPEGVGDDTRVYITMEVDGMVVWQGDWVRENLKRKESEIPVSKKYHSRD